MEIDNLINDYKNGMGIYDVCAKYHIGKLKLKSLLADNGVELRKKGKQPMDKSDFKIKDFREKKYTEHEGFHYVAVDKKNGFRSTDYLNAAGVLTTHIKAVYGVDIPTLYDRRIYYMKNGNYWWEQWFDIVEEKNEEFAIRCPYCDWGTNDAENRSGAFTHHLTSTHNISVKEHLEKYPEHTEYFKKQAKLIDKALHFEDTDNFVICPICNKKLSKITYSHLRNVHGMGMIEFKKEYPNTTIMSNEAIEQIVSEQKFSNLTVSKKRFISSYEREIGEYLKSLGIDFETNRQILIGKEIDILCNEQRIGIEFDGLLFHSEFFGRKTHIYHLDKTQKCNEKGYGLIHIFEDEYVNHKDIVLAKLKHIFGKDYDLPKIGARKMVIREILSHDAKEFLEKYHIQGFYKSSVYLGAFYNNELMAVMSFKNGGINHESCELTRYATNYNYRFQGLGSKMFTYFIRKYDPLYVISFADRRWTLWSTNNLYTNLGFELDSITRPDYRYYNKTIEKHKRIHKMTMSKSKMIKAHGFPSTMTELEMAKELGYDRIWDCGLFKYVWQKEQ